MLVVHLLERQQWYESFFYWKWHRFIMQDRIHFIGKANASQAAERTMRNITAEKYSGFASKDKKWDFCTKNNVGMKITGCSSNTTIPAAVTGRISSVLFFPTKLNTNRFSNTCLMQLLLYPRPIGVANEIKLITAVAISVKKNWEKNCKRHG